MVAKTSTGPGAASQTKVVLSKRRLEDELRTSPTAPTADETRSRLLEAGNVIFSELGFQAATTRMICERAQANPAAVNYHFGDKLGLYTEILKSNLSQEVLRVNREHLIDMDPEVALGEFISQFFHGLMNSDGKQRQMRILGHELSQPTPALAMVVEQIFRPMATLLCQIISRITGEAPEALGTVLACHGVIAQVTQYMTARPILNLLWTKWPDGAVSNEEIVAHITRMSLGGLRGLSRNAKAAKPTEPDKKVTRRRGRER